LIARGDSQRCLVVCPRSLAEQWQDELAVGYDRGRASSLPVLAYLTIGCLLQPLLARASALQ
jgi:hypothetical protein